MRHRCAARHGMGGQERRPQRLGHAGVGACDLDDQVGDVAQAAARAALGPRDAGEGDPLVGELAHLREGVVAGLLAGRGRRRQPGQDRTYAGPDPAQRRGRAYVERPVEVVTGIEGGHATASVRRAATGVRPTPARSVGSAGAGRAAGPAGGSPPARRRRRRAGPGPARRDGGG